MVQILFPLPPNISVGVDIDILQVMCNHSRKDTFICFQFNEKIYISLASVNDNTWNSTEMILPKDISPIQMSSLINTYALRHIPGKSFSNHQVLERSPFLHTTNESAYLQTVVTKTCIMYFSVVELPMFRIHPIYVFSTPDFCSVSH